MPVVSVRSVSKNFGKKKVVDNVSFDISPGEVFGLLGGSGSGKSTITSIILGLEKPSKGEVVLFNGDKRVNLHSRIALVSQKDSFFYNLTVMQNMNFFASVAGYFAERKRKRIDFLLKWLDLFEFKNSIAENLSGGYRRLLNTAISMIHDPDLIFFDEPSVGLDPKMRQVFWDKIIELKKSKKTIIITTHYMDEVQRLCDNIIILKNGSLLASGPPGELVSKFGGIRVVVFKIEGGVKDKDINVIKELAGGADIYSKKDFLFIPFKEERIVGRVSSISSYLIGKGYNIISSVTKEPTLDDVFINILGGQND